MRRGGRSLRSGPPRALHTLHRFHSISPEGYVLACSHFLGHFPHSLQSRSDLPIGPLCLHRMPPFDSTLAGVPDQLKAASSMVHHSPLLRRGSLWSPYKGRRFTHRRSRINNYGQKDLPRVRIRGRTCRFRHNGPASCSDRDCCSRLQVP